VSDEAQPSRVVAVAGFAMRQVTPVVSVTLSSDSDVHDSEFEQSP
jgi:hypothetical protein